MKILEIKFIQRNDNWQLASRRLRNHLQAFLTVPLFKVVNIAIIFAFCSSFVQRFVGLSFNHAQRIMIKMSTIRELGGQMLGVMWS